MFDNVSQGIFATGATGYLIVVPVLRSLVTLFMVISTYKLLKARQDRNKLLWVLAICFAPFIARIFYEIYRRWISKKEGSHAKGSTTFLILSIIAFVLSIILTVVSVITLGIGYIKSEIDGEPLATFYDLYGNEYDDLYNIPLYDRQGNVYTHESEWFTTGTYKDQNGNTYDGDFCYLSEDGYFYFDAQQRLTPLENSSDYYSDGETIYYFLWNLVYWEEDGTIYEKSGRFHLELFDFD